MKTQLFSSLGIFQIGTRQEPEPRRKIIVVRAFIRIMLVYSAIKNNANGPAAYSTLNPDTNSDSPSVRSKGARFVSARVEINHIMAMGQAGRSNHMCSWVVISVCRE